MTKNTIEKIQQIRVNIIQIQDTIKHNPNYTILSDYVCVRERGGIK